MGLAKFTFDERNKVIEELLKKSLQTLKRPPYTKEGIANGNFWDSAENYNMTPELALAVRMGEPVNAIDAYIKSNDKDRSTMKDLESIENRILQNINCLSVLYTLLVERGYIDHKPLQKITKSGSPLEKCSDCGATPDRDGNIYHTPGCRA